MASRLVGQKQEITAQTKRANRIGGWYCEEADMIRAGIKHLKSGHPICALSILENKGRTERGLDILKELAS